MFSSHPTQTIPGVTSALPRRPEESSASLSRRQFIGSVAGGAVGLWGARGVAAETKPPKLAFFLVGDTHYLAQKEQPGSIDRQSAEVTTRLIGTLNKLPGSEISAAAGGGVVATPQGVIHAGDLIDSGDKQGEVFLQMQKTEWETCQADFGLTGKDGKLKYPVYEVYGNHDGPSGKSLVIDGIIDRNKRRRGLTNISPNGVHYSWDWGGVHFVNLGIVVGQVKVVQQRRRFNPLDSLDFLAGDLAKHVGDSGRPIVITHHIDVARYTGPANPDDPKNEGKEWNPCDVRGFHDVIKKYEVAAILYGHTHNRAVLKWDGESAKGTTGINLFNCDNSSHFRDDKQALFYFEINDQELVAREYATADRWQTGAWTAQVWRRPIAVLAKTG